ncbi:MAG: SDR family NAD(P)-dependent oxidoreductase [Salibacteraceae bacterium]|nr:SDR family NAD(P)-dependent oxidoreductase [Salibacteraceae bacterium]|tara:strand:+ start:70673 stop:71377 length:705 start_codon:yes stop_codon:yes gene_type:complete
MEINNSRILITGGSSGIGKETAKQFIQKGAQVVITGRDENKLKLVATEIGAIPLLFDISDLNSINEMAAAALALLDGKIDVLINNAGIGVFPKLGEITVEDLQSVYATNVFGLTLLTQEIVKTFKTQNYGNIINIGSSASLKGFVGGSVYAASKFAVRGMTQSWQAELRKFNIRVSIVNPSEVATAFAAEDRKEREEMPNKLGSEEIAHSIVSVLEMRDKGFIQELNVWATNPF